MMRTARPASRPLPAAGLVAAAGLLIACAPLSADPASPRYPGPATVEAQGTRPAPRRGNRNQPPQPPTPTPPAPGGEPMPVPGAEPTPPGGEVLAHRHPEPDVEDQRWLNVEILNWILRPGPTPALVTRGPDGTGAILGTPGTAIVLRENAISGNLVGGRITYGRWFGHGQKVQQLGIEASYFGTGTPETQFTVRGSGEAGTLVVARPFFNTLTALPDSLIVAAPGLERGTVSTFSSAQLDGGNLDLLVNRKVRGHQRTDLLFGPAYLHLEESLRVDQQSVFLPATPAAGSRFSLTDRFATENHFYGGEVGARHRWHFGHFHVDLMGKVGLGIMQEEADIAGSSTLIDAAGVVTNAAGGFLGLPSNSGHFSRTNFAAVPQLYVGAAYQFTRRLKAIMGYNFIYATDALRPAGLIDTHINPSLVPALGGPPVGGAHPLFNAHGAEFSAQGLSAGLQWAF